MTFTPPTNRSIASLAALVAASLFFVGCATTRAIPDEPPKGTATLTLGAESSPGRDELAAADLYLTPDAPKHTFVDVDTGEDVTLAVSKTDRYGATWLIDEDRAGTTIRTEFLRRDDGDNIVMTAALDHKEQALSRFDPPLLVAPAKLEPESPVESRVAIKVLDSNNQDQTKESGRARRSLEYLGDQKITIDGRHLSAARVLMRFKADLNFADATNRHVYWVVPGQGVVAIERHNVVDILGLSSNTFDQKLARTDPPPKSDNG